MACCSANLSLPRNIPKKMLDDLMSQTRLNSNEVQALYARFRRLAPSGFMPSDQFRQALGILGLTDDAILPDRMFRVFDSNTDGQLDFYEFTSSLAVMLRGTEDEKLKLSFDMVAGQRNAEGILREDLIMVVNACNSMMSSLTENSRQSQSYGDEDTHKLFDEFAIRHASGEKFLITFEAYKTLARSNPIFLKSLGLMPNCDRRPTPKSTALTSASSPRACPEAPSPDDPSIGQAELEQLRSRVEELRKAVQGMLDRETSQSKQRHNEPRIEWSARSWFSSAWSCGTFGCSKPSLDDETEFEEVTVSSEIEKVDLPTLLTTGGQAVDAKVRAEIDNILEWCDKKACYKHVQRPSNSKEISSLAPSEDQRPCVRHHNSALPLDANTARRCRRAHRLLGPKKGLAVHFGHENWNMVISMMIGIRMSIGRVQHEIMRDLAEADFAMKEKFSIAPQLANIFDSTASSQAVLTRFIDHAPLVFERIRSYFGIAADDYARSVGPEQLLGNMVLGNLSALSELTSEGKSGAFFYYTADGKYMMKTVTPKEFLLLKKMLKSYYEHVTQNPNTLLVRFLGLHSLNVHEHVAQTHVKHATQKLYFVVMANMFNTPLEIHRRYDLKGSWVGRCTPLDKRVDTTIALKDVDFKEAGEVMRIGSVMKESLLAQVVSDANFLRDNGIIDYSLLVGIHDRPSACEADYVPAKPEELAQATGGAAQPPASPSFKVAPIETGFTRSVSGDSAVANMILVPAHQRDMGGLRSLDGQSLYYIGIIDILTLYDSSKMFEHHAKALLNDRRGVSCCPPGPYAERFNNFMESAFA